MVYLTRREVLQLPPEPGLDRRRITRLKDCLPLAIPAGTMSRCRVIVRVILCCPACSDSSLSPNALRSGPGIPAIAMARVPVYFALTSTDVQGLVADYFASRNVAGRAIWFDPPLFQAVDEAKAANLERRAGRYREGTMVIA